MDLTQGNITKLLIRFSIPIVLSLVCSVAYTIFDNIIVASCCGQDALATISSITGIVDLAYILLNGFASAFTIIASKNLEDKSKIYHHAIYSGFACGLFLTLFFVLGSNLFVKWANVPVSIQKDASLCLKVYGCSFFFSMFFNLLISLFNGFNDSKTPMAISVGSNILNIILDYLFLGIFHLPVIYAVIASLLSIMIGAIILFILIHRRYDLSHSKEFDFPYMKHIIILAFSMMLQQSIMNICGMLIGVKVNTLGIESITVNAACCNIQNLYILVFIGFTNAFAIFLGSNLASKQYKRMKEGAIKLIQIGLVLEVIMLLISYFTFPMILRIYISDLNPMQQSYGLLFQYIMMATFFEYFIKYLIDGFYKAYEEIKYFLISSAINLISRMAIVYLLIDSLGITSVAYAYMISITMALIYNILNYQFKFKSRLN